ncbi:alpha/beta fold hydrolase [Lysobacter pythonis]|uniref:Alpha/beta fold hydrolase n=1 Tax=Solilutibacter pythonis TaxID=2483112 RepID=A0A3M2HWP9_9GAMM|nr:alpha/beta fold hydrolase [Lysobacter pythonis]RMH94151.1 alpha/beta fold hydrolase [Lysobacter pythonis]
MSSAPPRVVLLHGLWMHAPAMRWFATRLKSRGFDAAPLGYYSLLEDTDSVVERLAEEFTTRPGSHVVAHSLGGLLALRAAARVGGERLGRIVCLGTPLAGSRAADGVRTRIPAGGKLLGRHLPLLLEGARMLPPGIEVGMVAGCRPLGLGGVVAKFDCAHDGTVALPETRIDGLTDHVTIHASHSGLIFSDVAVTQASRFLREGHFMHDGENAGIAR